MGKHTRTGRVILVQMRKQGGILRRESPFCRRAPHVIDVAGEINLRVKPLNFDGQLVECLPI